jgi:hypothetical protein
MAATIRIKRTTTSNRPASLANAELAFIEGSSILIYGTGSAGAGGSATSIIDVGGTGAFLGLSNSLTQTAAGAYTFSGTVDLTGTFKIGGTTVTSSAAELNLIDGSVANTVVNGKAVIYGASGEVAASSISTTGNASIGGNCTVTGNLTVNGTTTTINSTTMSVDDINVVLGDTASPSDASADGGGITLKGTSDKTLSWVNATGSWTSSEHFDLASGKVFKINGTNVLTGSALGSGITSSSLTSVGTIGTGTWQGTAVAVLYGGTGATTASGARTNLGLAIGTDVQAYSSTLAAVVGGTYTGATSITTLGTIATGTWQGTAVAIGYGGTGATNASGARTNLGLAIGTDVQAYNATLAAVAGGTYTGATSITTLGTIATGTWQGTAVGVAYGGTGLTSAVSGIVKGSGGAYAAAVAGTDYLDPNSTIDGGTYT